MEFPVYVAAAVAFFFILMAVIPPVYTAIFPGSVPAEEDLMGYTFTEHTDLPLHIHPRLEIMINGQNVTVPAGIGITEQGMRVIHTHDESGRIHIESPRAHQFYLKDFFSIWGERFDGKCISDYCEDHDHAIRLIVDGAESRAYQDLPLEDGQSIEIVYGRS